MKVFILAGGFATRLWPLTEKRAKPLLLLDGKTILAHMLEKIPQQAEIFLLTNKAFQEDFSKEMKYLRREKFHIFCEDSFSDGEKLGALKAVSLAIQEFKIEENIFVCAGDNILPNLNISSLACGADETCIAVREVESLYEAQKFGVVEIHEELKEKTLVINFEEKPEKPKSTLVSTGFFSLGKNLFSLLHDFAENSPDALGGVFPEFLKQKVSIWAEIITGEWFDVGSFETYLEAHKVLQSKKILCGHNVREEGNTFSGKVFLGEGAVIKNCQITDSIIYPKCRITNCSISQSVIDENCHLEGLDLNRKLVRKGTRLMKKEEIWKK